MSYCAVSEHTVCQRAFLSGLLSPLVLWLLWLVIKYLRTVTAIRLDSKPRDLKVRQRHCAMPAGTVS